jgi:hypothetical protein
LAFTHSKFEPVQSRTFLPSRLLSKKLKVRICKSIILPVFLYGCKIWSLILREEGRAIAQAVSRWFPPRRPGFAPDQIMWDLWWTKWHWGRFSPNTPVSPDNHHSTKFFILIITWGNYNRPIGGRRAEWTQLDSIPQYSNRIKG